MRHNVPDGRQLRFSLDLHADESVPGAIARAARQHVLVRTASVLEAACVSMKHAGYSQLGDPDELKRLSNVIRCSTDDLISRAGVRVIAPGTSRSVDARFGRLIIPRVHLELTRRRIAPRSLQECGYHRLNWMNLLLPYCDISFERLVSSCVHCGATLGWRYARGIDCCDLCGRQIAPSAEAALPEDLQDGYRLFARLSSLHPETFESTTLQLSKSLQAVAPGVLVQLALHVGGIVNHETVVTASRQEIAALDRTTMASIAIAGTEFLQTWPNGIRSWVAMQSEEMRETPAKLLLLRHRLKQLVNRKNHTDEFVGIVSDALPELQKRAAHGLPGRRRYYLYGEVDRLLGLDGPHMNRLRNWLGANYLQGRESYGKKFGQFAADQIDDLVPVFRDTIPFNSCANKLKMPVYAIEQLCRGDQLEWESHPALSVIRSFDSVRAESFHELHARLVDAACSRKLPLANVPLRRAVKRLGGRLKPWAAIIRSLADGSLPFWLPNGEITAAGIYVRPNDMEAFDYIDLDLPAIGLQATQTLSQLDAAEVLNIKPALLPQWAGELKLAFKRSGRALVAPLADVLVHARETAWTAEIAWHLKVRYNYVEEILQARSIKRSITGWSRCHLVKEGVLPRVPLG